MNDMMILNTIGQAVAITDGTTTIIMDNYGKLRIFATFEGNSIDYGSLRLIEEGGLHQDVTVLRNGKIFMNRRVDSIHFYIYQSLESNTRGLRF